MSDTVRIEVEDRDPIAALQGFLKRVLDLEDVSAVLAPLRLAGASAVMPTLATDPEALDRADPVAPAFPMNAARLAARLTRGGLNRKVAAVLRPCEIRAFVELCKLNQGDRDGLYIIGLDCLGAYENKNYPRFAREDGLKTSAAFLRNVHEGLGTAYEDFDVAPACRICERPAPEGADVMIGLMGVDIDDHLPARGGTEAGESLLARLDLPETGGSEGRVKALSDRVATAEAYRDKVLAETAEAVDSLEKLSAYLSGCINCYNCRVACPVCYCKECVFVTDVFDYEPWQYLGWARQRGALKMPPDTVFYHLTRLAHMSTACVGCGQCSNACPNDVPVMELFRSVAGPVQAAFDYEAGRDVGEPAPLSVFKEDEFTEVVGGVL